MSEQLSKKIQRRGVCKTLRQVAVLRVMADYANDDGTHHGRIPAATIASQLCMARIQVYRVQRELKAAGILILRRGGTRTEPPIYDINLDRALLSDAEVRQLMAQDREAARAKKPKQEKQASAEILCPYKPNTPDTEAWHRNGHYHGAHILKSHDRYVQSRKNDRMTAQEWTQDYEQWVTGTMKHTADKRRTPLMNQTTTPGEACTDAAKIPRPCDARLTELYTSVARQNGYADAALITRDFQKFRDNAAGTERCPPEWLHSWAAYCRENSPNPPIAPACTLDDFEE